MKKIDKLFLWISIGVELTFVLAYTLFTFIIENDSFGRGLLWSAFIILGPVIGSALWSIVYFVKAIMFPPTKKYVKVLRLTNGVVTLINILSFVLLCLTENQATAGATTVLLTFLIFAVWGVEGIVTIVFRRRLPI